MAVVTLVAGEIGPRVVSHVAAVRSLAITAVLVQPKSKTVIRRPVQHQFLLQEHHQFHVRLVAGEHVQWLVAAGHKLALTTVATHRLSPVTPKNVRVTSVRGVHAVTLVARARKVERMTV